MAKATRQTAEGRILDTLLNKENASERISTLRSLFEDVPWLRTQIVSTLREEERNDQGIRSIILHCDRKPSELQVTFAQEYLASSPEDLDWKMIMDILTYVPELREAAGKLVLARLQSQKDLSAYYCILHHVILWCAICRKEAIKMVLDSDKYVMDECKRLKFSVTAAMFTSSTKLCEKISLTLAKAAIRLISEGNDEDNRATFYAAWCKLWLREESLIMGVLDAFSEHNEELLEEYLQYTKP